MTTPKRPSADRLPVWTGDHLADALLRRCGFSDHLIRRAIVTMDEEMAATTPEGAPEWAARGRGVDHVLTVAGLKRVERQQGEGEGGGLTVVLRQYMIGAIAAATTAPRAPDLDMPALPVRSDRSLPPDEPAATTSSPSPPAAPDQPDDAALADTVRITVKHFGDPAPAEPR